jgi:hypothetical protein
MGLHFSNEGGGSAALLSPWASHEEARDGNPTEEGKRRIRRLIATRGLAGWP